jgi:hypothetical protein
MAPTDARFARLQTDPRFRKPKQKNLKVEIDERFRDVLESEEFGGGGAQPKAAGKGKGRAGASILPLIYSRFVQLGWFCLVPQLMWYAL